MAIAGLISCGALVGWLTDLPLLTNWEPDFVTMKPVAALAILLIALGLLPQLSVAPRSRIAIGVIGTLLGASSFIQELGGLDLRLESWLAPAGAVPGPNASNFLMSPATALAVLLAAAAVALLPFSRLADAVRFLAAGVGVVGATALVGYVLGVGALYSFPPFNSIALPTAVASIAISAAALTYVRPSSPARRGDWRLFLAQFFAPLLIFSLFTLWIGRSVEAQARADADRTAASASQYAQRVFEIQETTLAAVLHHVKGRVAGDVAADRSVHEFLSEIKKQTPTSDAVILVSDNGHVIAWSRGFPAPDMDVSQRDYFKAHRNGGQGVYIGEVISTAPFGPIGFTISRRDPGTGIIAVAQMPVDTFMRLSEVQVSWHDALTLQRADGMVLVTTLPLADPVGFQLPQDWFMPRLIRGEAKAGTIAAATLDGVRRLWQFRKAGHYPVYVIYGLDAAVIKAGWLHHIVPFGLLAFLASAATYSLSRIWQTAQERLATIVTSSADAIISKTPDGVVTSWNEAAERVFGYPAGEMIGQSIRRLIPADRQPEEDKILACLARGERIEHYETVRVTKDGRTINVSITVSPMRDDSGRITGASKIVRDITERKRAEQLLLRQADLLDQSHDAIFTWKLGGSIANWNRGAELLYGYTAQEAIGRSSHELLRTRSSIPMQEVEAQTAREGNWYGELTHTTRDGRTVMVESRHVRVCYDGEMYTLEANRDVTARKQADAERQKFVSLADHSTEFIGMADLEFKPLYLNEAGRRLVGLDSLEQARALRVQDFFFPEDRDYITNQFFPKVLRDGRFEAEIRFRHFKSGAALWVIYNAFEVRGEAGQVVGYATVSRDITARKRAEAQLAEREAQLALFVKHAPVAIAMFDDKMRYLAVSRRFISDYCRFSSDNRLPSDAEIIGRSHYEIVPDIPLRWREIHARVLAGEELSHEGDPYPRQDGQIDRVQWSMKPWRTADGRIGGAMLFIQDVTRALAEKEARFQATFENAAVGIAHVAPDGRWLRVNAALCRILDYPADELVAKSFQDISHPDDDLVADLAAHDRMLDGQTNSYETDKRFRRKDGSIVWVRLTVGCVRESEGSIDYFVSVVEDISARKRAEEELAKSEERFRTSILHSPVPTALLDDQEQMLGVSQSWLEAAGAVSADDFPRVKDWINYLYGERSGEMMELIREIIATEPEARTDELVVTPGGGDKRIWNFVTSCLGAQSDGRRLFVCVARDVTDRKAYEERINLLMREARHRTNNILGLVQVIARQTAAGDAQDFIGRFSKRIQALAANQDLLVRHEWQRIDVKDLVQSQLGHFADLIGTRINFDGPKLLLNAAAAQAIGLAIHELATNAGKYGALSTDDGRVDVSWKLEDETCTMGWIERNGPPVRPPDRRGFGSTVIESMVKRTLGGEVQLDYASSGLEWHLSCRAADALEGRD